MASGVPSYSSEILHATGAEHSLMPDETATPGPEANGFVVRRPVPGRAEAVLVSAPYRNHPAS